MISSTRAVHRRRVRQPIAQGHQHSQAEGGGEHENQAGVKHAAVGKPGRVYKCHQAEAEKDVQGGRNQRNQDQAQNITARTIDGRQQFAQGCNH